MKNASKNLDLTACPACTCIVELSTTADQAQVVNLVCPDCSYKWLRTARQAATVESRYEPDSVGSVIAWKGREMPDQPRTEADPVGLQGPELDGSGGLVQSAATEAAGNPAGPYPPLTKTRLTSDTTLLAALWHRVRKVRQTAALSTARVTCPSCGTVYRVRSEDAHRGGREVRCARCDHQWKQTVW